jgi:hypothetical protein
MDDGWQRAFQALMMSRFHPRKCARHFPLPIA